MTEQELDRILARYEPQVAATFREALADIAVDRDALVAALDAGDLAAALGAIGPVGVIDVGVALGAVAVAAVELPSHMKLLASIDLPGGKTGDIVMNLRAVNDHAVRWAQRHAAKNVQQITTDTRLALQELIEQALSGQLTRRDAQDRIIDVLSSADVAQMVERAKGLTSRDVQALKNFELGMWRDGVPSRTMRRRADDYAMRALRRRAELIARTEVITAANMGTVQMAQQTMEQLGGIVTVRWVVVEDERLCPMCAVMEGQSVVAGEPFDRTRVIDGERVLAQADSWTQPRRAGARPQIATVRPLTDSGRRSHEVWLEQTGGKGPALHPGCRCDLVMSHIPSVQAEVDALTEEQRQELRDAIARDEAARR